MKHLIIAKTTTDLKCPYCFSLMEELEEISHYGTSLKIDRCPKCNSVWFDNRELWYLADLTTMALSLGKNLSTKKALMKKITSPDKFLCPRCGIKLSLLVDPNIPSSIEIWRCKSCHGNWLQHKELHEYGLYRKRLFAKRSLRHY